MKNILIAVGSVLGFVLLVGWCASGSSTPPISSDLAATAERVVEETQRSGLVMKVDDRLSHVYVQPSVWARTPIDDKRAVAKAFAIYFKRQGQGGYAHIYDNLSGKRIATMTSGWDFSTE